MKQGILLLIALLVVMPTMLWASPIDKDKYRQYANGYPQIIQAQDYKTIQSIESLFSGLSKLGEEGIDFDIRSNALIFKLKNNKAKSVVVETSDSKKVSINNVHYSRSNTRLLYATLIKVLSDLSAESKCEAVAFTQHPTKAYKKRTIIEFKYGAKVVDLDCFSNGPNNPERLYVLDLIDTKDSYFWGKIEK